jgi:hypothetical protein
LLEDHPLEATLVWKCDKIRGVSMIFMTEVYEPHGHQILLQLIQSLNLKALPGENRHSRMVIFLYRAALRGAATLKARALKDVLNVAAAIPIERCTGICGAGNNGHHNRSYSGELVNGENFLGACSVEFLARGSELLKRTRQGKFNIIINIFL